MKKLIPSFFEITNCKLIPIKKTFSGFKTIILILTLCLASIKLNAQIDNTGPGISITSPSTSGSFITSQSAIGLSGTASDPSGVSSVTWFNTANSTSGTASGTTSWSIGNVPLVNGTNVIIVTATDAVGNTTNANITVTRDNTGPSISITSPSTSGSFVTNQSAIGVSGTASDPSGVSSVTWINTANSTSGTASGTTSWSIGNVPLVNGTNLIIVTATDAVGNTTNANITVTRDNTGPSISITSPSTSGSFVTNQSAIGVSGTASDPSGVSSVTWINTDNSTSGTASGTTSWSIGNVPLVNGTNVIIVTATDALGNTSNATITVMLDTQSPNTTITVSEPNPSNDVTGDFMFTINESGTFEVSVDGGPYTPASSPFSTSSLADGMHTFSVRGIDDAGNVDPTPATDTWVVDTQVPNTTITVTEPNPTSDVTGDFMFTSNESGTFEVSVDGGAYTPASSPFSTSSLADGMHAFSVRAIDAAGNVDPSPATDTWLVDTQAPNTTITVSEPNPTNDVTGDFMFTSNESGTFEVSVDGGAYTPANSPFSTSSLADGMHTFSVRAIDDAGNVDPTPATDTWVVDTQGPSVTINQAGAQTDPTNIGNINFTAVFSEAVSGFTGTSVTLSGTAGFGSATITVTGGPMTYNIAVSGITSDGTIIATIPSGGASDTATNFNMASTSTDNTITLATCTDPSVPTLLASTSTICPGGSTTINITSGSLNDATNWQWYSTSCGGTYAGNGTSVSVSPTVTTTYYARGEGGCIVSGVCANITITVNSNPTISVNSGVICAGQSFTMVPSGATTYTYSSGTDVVMPTSDTAFSVNGTDANGCVSSLAAFSNVTVNALPVLSTTSTSTLMCTGETATLSVSGASTYTWSTTENTSDIAVSPSTQTTYTVDGIDANGCMNTTTITQDVLLCTGLANNSASTILLSIFPNPSNGMFTIKSDMNLNLILTNALGQAIQTIQLNDSNNRQMNVDVLSNGIYFIIGQNSSQSVKQKVIVTK